MCRLAMIQDEKDFQEKIIKALPNNQIKTTGSLENENSILFKEKSAITSMKAILMINRILDKLK